jgi:putative membrane protein
MAMILAQMMDHDWRDHDGRGWGWIVGAIFMIAILTLVVVLIVRLTSHPTPPTTTEPPRRSAEDVLADRLARGEIDPDEYRERLEALR